MNSNELLNETAAYMPPVRLIEDLTGDEAETRVGQAPHSIAEIVAHLAFWQDWFARRVRSSAEPMPEHAALGWPPVAPGTWAEVRARLSSGVQAWSALDAVRPLSPPLEHPGLAHYTAGDALVHVAVHNAHHLGQVVLLRQLMGRWPPPAGSWTW